MHERRNFMAKEVGMICEQGDMGLFYDPLSESDQKTYEQQRQKENRRKSNSASNEENK
jgi:hypothetical protein